MVMLIFSANVAGVLVVFLTRINVCRRHAAKAVFFACPMRLYPFRGSRRFLAGHAPGPAWRWFPLFRQHVSAMAGFDAPAGEHACSFIYSGGTNVERMRSGHIGYLFFYSFVRGIGLGWFDST